MKHIYLISLGGLVLLLAMFFIAATFQANSKYKFRVPATEMLQVAAANEQFIDSETLRKLKGSSTGPVIIDIRTPKEFMTRHIEGAINIPVERLLDESHEALFSDDSEKVLYGTNSVMANSAWVLLTQYGYTNLSVLNGGINSWQDTTRNNGNKAATGLVIDEKPAYDYAGIMENTAE